MKGTGGNADLNSDFFRNTITHIFQIKVPSKMTCRSSPIQLCYHHETTSQQANFRVGQ
jgi:hypothetical protein